MNKNFSQSYQTLRKKSQLVISDSLMRSNQKEEFLKNRAKSITNTSIKKPLTIIKPPSIDITKIETSPFTFANRKSDHSTDQTNSRSIVSQSEIPQTKNSNHTHLINRQKQLLEYRLSQDYEQQKFTQNYDELKEKLQKLEKAKIHYINQMNQFTEVLKVLLIKDD